MGSGSHNLYRYRKQLSHEVDRMTSPSLHFILLLLSATFAYKCLAYDCPEDYPMESCPTAHDEDDLKYCCYSPEDSFHCCAQTLPTWAIVLICLGVLMVLIIVGALICCCCGFCACLTSCCRCCRKG